MADGERELLVATPIPGFTIAEDHLDHDRASVIARILPIVLTLPAPRLRIVEAVVSVLGNSGQVSHELLQAGDDPSALRGVEPLNQFEELCRVVRELARDRKP